MKSLLGCRLFATLTLTLVSATLRAEPATPTIEERLARLESAIARIESRLDEAGKSAELTPTLKEYHDLTKALGWDGKSALPAVKPAGKEKSLALGGFVHAHVESSGAPDARYNGINNRFFLRRARIFASGTFAEDFSFKLETDLGTNSISNRAVVVGQGTDMFVAWTKYPASSFRLGQFKTPFGYEQITSDTKIYTIERSLPNDRLTIGRQIGAMMFGDLAEKRLSYGVGIYNGTGTNTSIGDNQHSLAVGRVAGVLLDTTSGVNKVKLTAGANYFGTMDKANPTLGTTFTGHKYGSGLDAQLVFGPAEIQAEWLQNELHPVTGAATEATGWALLGAYSLTPKWQGVVRYETFDSNTATGNTTTEVWTLGINYLIKGDDLKLSLNYLSGQQPDPTPQGDRLIGRMQLMF
jgi:phosphate-selective porin OprO and OprP